MNIHNNVIHNSQKNGGKNSNVQSNKWINKMLYILTMKYHFTTKRNEVQYMIQHE